MAKKKRRKSVVQPTKVALRRRAPRRPRGLAAQRWQRSATVGAYEGVKFRSFRGAGYGSSYGEVEAEAHGLAVTIEPIALHEHTTVFWRKGKLYILSWTFADDPPYDFRDAVITLLRFKLSAPSLDIFLTDINEGRYDPTVHCEVDLAEAKGFELGGEEAHGALEPGVRHLDRLMNRLQRSGRSYKP